MILLKFPLTSYFFFFVCVAFFFVVLFFSCALNGAKAAWNNACGIDRLVFIASSFPLR